MAERDDSTVADGMVTVTRIIEMHGPAAWINEVLKRSYVPLNGTRLVGSKGAYMRGGVVMWSPAEPEPVDHREQGLDKLAEQIPVNAEPEEPIQAEQPRPRFEDSLSTSPLRDRTAPLRVPKPTGAK